MNTGSKDISKPLFYLFEALGKNSLVAYDGSPSADAAFKAALDLAKTYATSLTVQIVGAFNRSRVRALAGMRELG